MDTHPMLKFLAKQDDPPLGAVQTTAAAIIDSPASLSDLAHSGQFDDLLALLITKLRPFKTLLLTVGPRITDKDRFSYHATPFVRQLIRFANDLLDRSDYHDIVYAGLQLCWTGAERSKLFGDLAASGEILELLSVSDKGHHLLMPWMMNLNEGVVDGRLLDDWTQRLVALVHRCPTNHKLATILVRWRKISTLKQVLKKVIQGEEQKARTSKSHISSEAFEKEKVFNRETLLLFAEFDLPAPQSQSLQQNHLNELDQRETLSVLRQVLGSFPCGPCEYFLYHGATLLHNRSVPIEEDDNADVLDDASISAGEGLGVWQVVLSSRAYRNLQTFEGDPRLKKALSSNLVDLATGSARSEAVKFRHGTSRVPLRASKWRSNTYFLWQVDIAPGPRPNLEQQVIKVWTVGSRKILESMLSEVRKYQNSLPEGRITRSLEVGPLVGGKQQPKIYDHQGVLQDQHHGGGLDIRLIDQEFIDTFNKSFTLTQGLLRSIIQGDLTAEFPFDLSSTESEIIQHSKTPTLIMGRSGTGKTTCLVFKMLAKHTASSKVSPERQARQVLLTRSENLAEKLQIYSRRLIATISQKGITPCLPGRNQQLDQQTLFDLDEKDFPLVCTYDQFMSMLQGAIQSLVQRTFPNVAKNSATMVDFKAFRKMHWPHFPDEVKKGLLPQLVFSEIMGVIKGSIYTCKSLTPLRRHEYLELSARVAPNITSRDDRSRVYRIYEAYEKRKLHTCGQDNIDLILHLLQQLRDDLNTRSLLASYVDEIYVDEVQDLRSVEIALLLTLGNNPRGFHFAGDTAQGISQDSTFRFQDVKALFYDHFHRQSLVVGQEELVQPLLFTLNRNYRSHQGILSLASAVMDLLWRQFPDTVDKLGPEVGSLVGPTPTLFVGCDATTLIRPAAEDDIQPEHELLFGAEQVIITRDEDSKMYLLEQIGEAALVLTILQSKGMEFDDVILWDFFTSTPDPAGWRSLQNCKLETYPAFNPEKHAGLCSELKHLYVAITRARIRFLMVERSDEATQPFVNLMNQDSALARLEVTSMASADFQSKIKALQPRRSDDPNRWYANGEDMMARGLFADAGLCFRRAGEPLKEKKAEGYLKESQAEELAAKQEQVTSRSLLEEAIGIFQELGSTEDIARLLMRLERTEEAAEIWFTEGKFRQAALLFEKALLHERASASWHRQRDYNQAAMCLRNGGLYDQMVLYLIEHIAYLGSQERLRHQRVVKLLIKQQKLSPKNQKPAIRLLGSVDEQEAFYLEYDMVQSLLELYQEQKAYKKLLPLLLKLRRLDQALELASSMPCWGQSILDKGQLSRLISIIYVDHFTSNHASLPDYLASSNEKGDIHLWRQALTMLYAWDHAESQKSVLCMGDNSIAKAYISLRVAMNVEEVTSASKLNEIPFQLLCHAVDILKTQQTEPCGVVGEATLLLSGVLRGFDSLQSCTLQTWSPLREAQGVSKGSPLTRRALIRAFDQVTQAVIRMHELAKRLFREKWPTRCSFFLVMGKCGKRSEPAGCPHIHEHVTQSLYIEMLKDLLSVNRLLCETTPLYHRRLMSEQVSKTFLGARRYWLENLIGALSFISAYEQDSHIVRVTTRRIHEERSLRAVASCLEDLLLYRARNEWSSQASLGYVLEQLDLAALLGENVKSLLIRRTSVQLRYQFRTIYDIIVLTERLRPYIESSNAYQSRAALRFLLYSPRGIMKLQWQAFEVFNSHTAFFESIALYLLLRISSTSILVPRSWIDLHLPSVLHQDDVSDTPAFDQRQAYRDTIILLLKAFVELLRWLHEPLQVERGFSHCGREFPIRLLQQRNSECLAIILVNLLTIGQLPPEILEPHWHAVNEIFGLSTVKAYHLKHTVGREKELQSKLLESHNRYHGKNPLCIISVTEVQIHPFTSFQRAHNLAHENLSTLRTQHVTTKPSKPTTLSDTEQAAQEAIAKEAASCIWAHWQKYGLRLKDRKAFANTEKGRIILKLQTISVGAPFKIRCVLLYFGTECFTKLGPLGLLVADLRGRAFARLDDASIEDSETLDTVLEAVGKLEEGLTAHHERLSDEILDSLIEENDVVRLKELLRAEFEEMAMNEEEVASLSEILKGMTKG